MRNSRGSDVDGFECLGAPRKRAVAESHAVVTKPERTSSYTKGVCAEEIAAQALNRKGFKVLDRRYRTPAGEIDLVAVNGGNVSFVEVKRRSSRVAASEAITPRQQARIAAAAEIWLQDHPERAACGINFDAVLICPHQAPYHIPDAFRPAE